MEPGIAASRSFEPTQRTIAGLLGAVASPGAYGTAHAAPARTDGRSGHCFDDPLRAVPSTRWAQHPGQMTTASPAVRR